jgi:heme/copper-type cytochrome/quinol oxidase subunit 3
MPQGGVMTERDLRLIHPAPPPEKRQVVASPVLGVTIFIFTEVMLFAGFLSAFSISASQAPMWPPPNQPRLPIEATAVNTAALLLSGVSLWWAGRRFAEDHAKAVLPYLFATVLGAFFVLFQGYEWQALLAEGLGLTTSTHASFFYLIVGMHALHVIGALAVLVALFRALRRDTLTTGAFSAMRLYWYFVVGLWPILYWRVYL